MDNCFRYYIKNKKEILNNLQLKLIQLKGLKYVCSDKQLPEIERQIQNTYKAINFNKQLRF